jgi:hypothetical protein
VAEVGVTFCVPVQIAGVTPWRVSTHLRADAGAVNVMHADDNTRLRSPELLKGSLENRPG